MNSKQLQYAILISQIRNFSQVAEKLNISQPALSKQILHLEDELGIKLFERNTTPLTVTPAGMYFIREAQDLIYKEEQLLRSMEKFKSGEEGVITIGVSPFRSLYLLPRILKQVKDRFPGIQIILHENSSDQLRKDAADGKYDLAIVNLPVDDSVLEVQPIEPDILVLAVPSSMLYNLPNIPSDSGKIPTISFRDCKNLPFIAVSPQQEMRRFFEKLCSSSDFHPHISAEVVGLSTAWALVQAGIGATLLPLQFVETNMHPDVTLFALENNVYSRQPVIVTRRNQYISEPAQYVIELLTKTHQ